MLQSANMRHQIAFGFLYFFMLVVSISWSYEVRSRFRLVKSDNNEVLCATSPPNQTLSTVASRLHCVSSCNHQCPSPCKAVNYWTNAQLCQHFHYLPCSYEVQQDCANYQAMLFKFWRSSDIRFHIRAEKQ